MYPRIEVPKQPKRSEGVVQAKTGSMRQVSYEVSGKTSFMSISVAKLSDGKVPAKKILKVLDGGRDESVRAAGAKIVKDQLVYLKDDGVKGKKYMGRHFDAAAQEGMHVHSRLHVIDDLVVNILMNERRSPCTTLSRRSSRTRRNSR